MGHQASAQFEALASDLLPAAAKSGMLASAEVVVLCDDRGFDDARGIHLSILGKGSALGAFEAGGTGCQTIRDILSQ